MRTKQSKLGRNVIWTLVVLMAILHHDFWWWDDKTIVMGIMPVGLFYHMMYSLAAGGIWALAIKFAWPHHIEEWASEGEQPGQQKVPQTGGQH